MESRVIVREGIGVIEIKKSKKAKKLTIKVKEDCSVSVTLPYVIAYKTAYEFVDKNIIWIQNAVEKYKTKFVINKEIIKPGYIISTPIFEIRITEDLILTSKVEKEGNGFIIKMPIGLDYSNEKNQSTLKSLINRILTRHGKSYLIEKTLSISNKFNIPVGKISVRNNKSRWGSCSGINNISLNIQLFRLPEHLIDYVILHELAHVKHKNHGKYFWEYLDELTNNRAKKLSKELNNYRCSI